MGRNTNSAPRFSFSIDLHSGVPVYRQLIDQVRSLNNGDLNDDIAILALGFS